MPPLKVTIFLDTFLVLEIPNGVADWAGWEMICQRELENGEKIKLSCEGVPIWDSQTGAQVLRNVRILNICGQNNICSGDEPLKFEIQIKNPSTNERPGKGIFKITMRHNIGIDIGKG